MNRSATRTRGLACLLALTLTALTVAQPPAPPPAPGRLAVADDTLPKPKATEQPIYPSSFPPGLDCGIPVTLHDVLRLAIVSNLDIELARVAVERARIGVRRVGARFLPNLAMGGLYTTHEGTIQNTAGNISYVNRDSLFTGLGMGYVVSLSDVIYAVPEARRLVDAARFGQTRVMNDTLLRVAEAYFTVLRARRQLARLDETIEFLTSEEESELRGKSKGLLPLITAFVKAGTALPSDQTRVEADVVRRMAERVQQLEAVRTASAELARLLHLDPSYFLIPAEDYRRPLLLPGEQWCAQPMEVLVGQALRSRPELAENNALIEAAIARYRSAQWRPLLPHLIANLSYGGFGGGPEVERKRKDGSNVLGRSGIIADFDHRTDIDLGVQWRLEGMGLGNLWQIRDRRLQLQQVQLRNLQLQDLVVSQVVQAVEQVRRGRERVELINAGLFDPEGKPGGAVYRSLRLNFVRIKGGQGLPLEVLDSTRRLSDVLGVYAEALSDYDRARVRLLVALGLPTQSLIELDPPPPPGP